MTSAFHFTGAVTGENDKKISSEFEMSLVPPKLIFAIYLMGKNPSYSLNSERFGFKDRAHEGILNHVENGTRTTRKISLGAYSFRNHSKCGGNGRNFHPIQLGPLLRYFSLESRGLLFTRGSAALPALQDVG